MCHIAEYHQVEGAVRRDGVSLGMVEGNVSEPGGHLVLASQRNRSMPAEAPCPLVTSDAVAFSTIKILLRRTWLPATTAVSVAIPGVYRSTAGGRKAIGGVRRLVGVSADSVLLRSKMGGDSPCSDAPPLPVEAVLGIPLMPAGVRMMRRDFRRDLFPAIATPDRSHRRGVILLPCAEDTETLAVLFGAGTTGARQARRTHVIHWRSASSGGIGDAEPAPRPARRRGGPSTIAGRCRRGPLDARR
jgi:hypothetical protein